MCESVLLYTYTPLTGHAEVLCLFGLVATLWASNGLSLGILYTLTSHMIITEAYLTPEAGVLTEPITGCT